MAGLEDVLPAVTQHPLDADDCTKDTNRQLMSAVLLVGSSRVLHFQIWNPLIAQALCSQHVSTVMSQTAVPDTPRHAPLEQLKQKCNSAFVLMQRIKSRAD